MQQTLVAVLYVLVMMLQLEIVIFLGILRNEEMAVVSILGDLIIKLLIVISTKTRQEIMEVG